MAEKTMTIPVCPVSDLTKMDRIKRTAYISALMFGTFNVTSYSIGGKDLQQAILDTIESIVLTSTRTELEVCFCDVASFCATRTPPPLGTQLFLSMTAYEWTTNMIQTIQKTWPKEKEEEQPLVEPSQDDNISSGLSNQRSASVCLKELGIASLQTTCQVGFIIGFGQCLGNRFGGTIGNCVGSGIGFLFGKRIFQDMRGFVSERKNKDKQHQ